MIVVPDTKKIQILLIEDNAGDTELIKHNFESSNEPTQVNCVQDGEAALSYLRKTGCYADAKRPDLILLDLNLPRKDGREILDTIKQDPIFKIIPVIVLTNSDEDRDIIMSYILHANAYIAKPMGFDAFNKVIDDIKNFWLKTVHLP